MDTNLMERTTQPRNGKEPDNESSDISMLNLRPALFAGYRDLSKLRYDYPLVLTNNITNNIEVDGDTGGTFVRSLTGIINGILQGITQPGAAGERTRKHVLALEEAMRGLVARGTGGSLTQLWDMAEEKLVAGTEEPKQPDLIDSLSQARRALDLEGDVIDCTGETPVKVFTHAWNQVQDQKSRQFQTRITALIQNLRDILDADFVKSDKGRAPEALKDSIGAAYENVFDFKAFSQILGSSSFEDLLPERRRQRVCDVLSVLESQTFFVSCVPEEETLGREVAQDFVFNDCAQALDTFQKRLPEMVALVKAMSIATLEIENRYRESKHDAFFDNFDAGALGAEDLTLFPSYLVCLRDQPGEALENSKLIEALTSNLPIKVLAQSDDILGETLAAPERADFGTAATRLAGMALGLNSAYVLQASSANLCQMKAPIWQGLTHPGPALFSIFSGSAGTTAGLQPYLVAAAAMQARAFPSFSYDPAAGYDWASRFQVSDNPQADADWPVDQFRYEDRDQQTRAMDLAFTFADFVACDQRYAGHFAKVPAVTAQENLIPLREHLNAVAPIVDEIPYLPMIGDDFVVHKVSVSDKVVRAARRCLDKWRSLQELGGINNSHAKRLLDQEKETWAAEKESELAALRQQLEQKAESPALAGPPAPEAQASPEAPAVPAEAAEPEEEAIPPGEPYIDTARCTTCNECTDLNNKMFAYNDDKQAFIADINAGTYRQLVEAAENCQVSIIRPGLPKNPNEPNLDELIARAEPFN